MKEETKDRTIYLKVTCLTPKGKNEQCMKEWSKQFPTFKKPIQKGLINDNVFFWVYKFKNTKDMLFFNKKVLIAEPAIKKTYRFMLKFFLRANKIINKSAWGLKKTKNWLIKQWTKKFKGENGQIERMKDMDETEFKEHLKINDEAEIREFLDKNIIRTQFSYDAKVFEEW